MGLLLTVSEVQTTAQPGLVTETTPLPDGEHAAMVRYLARLQQRMSQLVQAHESQLMHWQNQLMRQTIRLMLARSCHEWGLLVERTRDLGPSHRRALAAAQAGALVCRTGCVMDDQHWRDGDLCRLRGGSCLVDDI